MADIKDTLLFKVIASQASNDIAQVGVEAVIKPLEELFDLSECDREQLKEVCEAVKANWASYC